MPDSLILDGTEIKSGTSHRHLVIVNDNRVLIRHTSLLYLLALVAGRLAGDNDGWVDKMDIEPGNNQIRYIHGLRIDLGPWGKWIENDRGGHYRIAPGVQLGLNAGELGRSDDHRIVAIVQEVILAGQ